MSTTTSLSKPHKRKLSNDDGQRFNARDEEDRDLRVVTNSIINDCLFFAGFSKGKYSADDVLRKAKEAIEAQLKANEAEADERKARKAMRKSKRQKLAPVDNHPKPMMNDEKPAPFAATRTRSAELMTMPNEIHLEIAKYLDTPDIVNLVASNRHLQKLHENSLYQKPSMEQLLRVVAADNDKAFRRFLANGLDRNLEMASTMPLLDEVMFSSTKENHQILKTLLRDRRTDTSGFQLFTTPTLMEQAPNDSLIPLFCAAHLERVVVDDEEDFPLISTDTWLGALYNEEFASS